MSDDNVVFFDFNTAPDQEELETPQHDDQRREVVREKILSQLRYLLADLFPNGKIIGHEFRIGNIQGDPGESLCVDLRTARLGLWYDFATFEGGDVFALWAGKHGLSAKSDFPAILEGMERWLGIEHTKTPPIATSSSKSKQEVPLGKHTARYDYLDATGALIACMYRYDLPNGKKHFRPFNVKTRRHHAPETRPLYNQPGIVKADTVILVEGEKCADALINIGICATTAMNGASAPVDKTDWSLLKGKNIIIWPDNDETGKAYAGRVSEALQCVAKSVLIKLPPPDRPNKWDAADAVAEGFDIEAFLSLTPSNEPVPNHFVAQLMADAGQMPEDIIAPRILTLGSHMVFAGAPKVGKTDFMLSWLLHMAAGMRFLDFEPPRQLRIFYLQAEIQYHYLRERIQALRIDPLVKELAGDYLTITPKLPLLLDEQGVSAIARTIKTCFPDNPVDIIAIDPLRNVFDGGKPDASENDNSAMLFFLRERVEKLRHLVNPDAGIILTHHTKKIQKKQLEEDPFQSMSGASALRGYYSTGIIMHRPDEQKSPRQLLFELRNGPPIPTKWVDKIDGHWMEIGHGSDRLVNKEHGHRLDAERTRKHDVILQLIAEKARERVVYTMNQFAECFEGTAGLGSKESIRRRLDVLCTTGYIKFFRNPEVYKLPVKASHTRYGLLCVEDMKIPLSDEDNHTEPIFQVVAPTHYKCAQTAAVLPVENSSVWIYQKEN